MYNYVYLPEYPLRVKVYNTIFVFFPSHICIESQGQRFISRYEADFSYFVLHLCFSSRGEFGDLVLSFRTYLLNS